MEMYASLPATHGRCSAHRQVELVVPLLLVLVLGAEKLADAHVVCLRGGGWVSSTEGSVRRCWPAGAAIYLLQTDFFSDVCIFMM